jgi:hypothetical protein
MEGNADFKAMFSESSFQEPHHSLQGSCDHDASGATRMDCESILKSMPDERG